MPSGIAYARKTDAPLENILNDHNAIDTKSIDQVTGFVSREREYKSNLGQFMTSPKIANFMASLLTKSNFESCSLLDAGAGLGALSCAALENWKTHGVAFQTVHVDAFEIDTSLVPSLSKNLTQFDNVEARIFSGDFIEAATTSQKSSQYSHAILNPPYKKISSDSEHRSLLRTVGIETGNLYSAFVALALKNMKKGGQVVAIIPRSFCNGPYFKPFRQYILENAAITHLHLFKSRTDAFKNDNVLQENIIIRLEREAKQSEVNISTSTDASFSDCTEHSYEFSQIVQTNDVDQFIHIPTEPNKFVGNTESKFLSSPEDIDVSISTGPVVGFRLKEHLRENLEENCVPLIYPSHLKNGQAHWPLENGKKANAIHQNENTQKWLYPNGYYCVVRRFSSKEERHRIVASVISPDTFEAAKHLGIDNKLNVFHFEKKGISRDFAHGLATFLNTDLVDEEFRLFSGHTQVNATDLRRLNYPTKETLTRLGKWVQKQSQPTKEQIYNYLGITIS